MHRDRNRGTAFLRVHRQRQWAGCGTATFGASLRTLLSHRQRTQPQARRNRPGACHRKKCSCCTRRDNNCTTHAWRRTHDQVQHREVLTLPIKCSFLIVVVKSLSCLQHVHHIVGQALTFRDEVNIEHTQLIAVKSGIHVLQVLVA